MPSQTPQCQAYAHVVLGLLLHITDFLMPLCPSPRLDCSEQCCLTKLSLSAYCTEAEAVCAHVAMDDSDPGCPNLLQPVSTRRAHQTPLSQCLSAQCLVPFHLLSPPWLIRHPRALLDQSPTGSVSSSHSRR